MPLNLIKVYPDLLELLQFNEKQRIVSLNAIFKRDIEENENFKFKGKSIYPVKKDGQPTMQTLFRHLTTKDNLDSTGKKTGSRSFEMQRSQRLHWIKHHIDGNKNGNVEVFSFEDRIEGKSKIRTYIYDVEQAYVIVLEPYRNAAEYYLLTAYYLNESQGKKQINKKLSKKLEILY